MAHHMIATVALCLLGHIDPSHFAGALSDEEGPATTPVEQMTREQLEAELNRLDKYRTEFIGPVVMTGSGGVVAIIGAVFLVLGVFYVALAGGLGGSAGLAIAGYVLMAIGGAFFIAGGIVLSIGLAKLFPALSRRRDAMERRQELQRQLDLTEPLRPQPELPNRPPADTHWLGVPRPPLVLAEF